VTRFISPPLFSIVASLGYAVAVYVNYPLFRYYPLVERFSLIDIPDRSLGPAMTWYGWIAIAIIPAIIVGVIGQLFIPARWLDKLARLIWVVPFVILYAGWVAEKSWLLGAGG
jgi:undecaprenyl pyrophosphate phosphatase UppP|tara:strand:- start:388 stop:726 length:339 start_codon:yes stop_codon:yes gene_type:complete